MHACEIGCAQNKANEQAEFVKVCFEANSPSHHERSCSKSQEFPSCTLGKRIPPKQVTVSVDNADKCGGDLT